MGIKAIHNTMPHAKPKNQGVQQQRSQISNREDNFQQTSFMDKNSRIDQTTRSPTFDKSPVILI